MRDRECNKKIIRYSSIGMADIVVIGVLISVIRTGVEKRDLVLPTVDKGMIKINVNAFDKIVPVFKKTIDSPISGRIVEVYRKGGDGAETDTPILKLDLQSTETEYKKLLDEEQMRRYELDQLRVNNQTKLSGMAIWTKVSIMKLSRMKVELRSEHHLDSLRAGTADKVRQAELNYNVAQLEYEQLQQQHKNEKEVVAAKLKVQELDFSIFRKGLAGMKRTLDDTQIQSLRKAILTHINNQIGARISQGEQVAITSDLGHFKVESEIVDTYGNRVAAGGKTVVKIDNDKLEGTISSVASLSKNGVISFTVQLKDDSNHHLRSGLETGVYVMNAIKEDAMRMVNASFYVGRGEYDLFVRTSDDGLAKRKVQLGDSNFEYMGVVSGLQSGGIVVVNDMSSYKNEDRLKMR